MATNWIQLIIAAIVFAIVSMIVHSVGAFVDMGYYFNPAYFPLWSTLMMPGPNPPGMMFYAVSLLFSLISGLIFAWAYSVADGYVPGKGMMKGLNFGIYLFLLTTVTGSLSMYLTLALPLALIISWAVQGLAVFLLWGAVLPKIVK
jgi:hypothetical protein